MNKLFALVAILSISAIPLAFSAQSGGKATKASPPASNRPAANPSMSSVQSDGVLVSAPVQSNSDQLIRNSPYQAAVAQKSAIPEQSAAPSGSHLVACTLGGFEQKTMTSDECKAKGGKEVVTAELPKATTPQH